jgi:hypothetical protein
MASRKKKIVSVDLKCRNEEAWLTHSPAGLAISSHEVTLCRGSRLTIHIVPPVGRGRARTSGRKPWLNATNRRRKDRIVLTAREPIGTFKYTITIKGVGTIDPGVRVV